MRVHAHMYVCGVECSVVSRGCLCVCMHTCTCVVWSVVSKICADQMLICEILLFFLSLYHSVPLSNRCCSPQCLFLFNIFWGVGGVFFVEEKPHLINVNLFFVEEELISVNSTFKASGFVKTGIVQCW